MSEALEATSGRRSRGTIPPGTIALFTLIALGSATGNLSQTALNAMLQIVIADFGIGVDTGQWLTTIYMLVLGIVVPVTSFLYLKMSEKAYLLMSLALFAIGSLVDALSVTFVMLVVGRVLQAVSTGFLMPIMMTVAMMRFPRTLQGTAMGIGGIAMGFAPNVGPTIGSALAASFGWRSFFILLAIIPAILFLVALFAVKREPVSGREAHLDLPSFLLSAIGFGGLLTGLSNSSTKALTSPLVWLPVLVGVLCLVAFFSRQKRIAHPLIHLDIFKSRTFSAGFWMQNLLFASFMGITLIIPLYIQNVLGGTAVDSGIVLLPGAVTALIFNPLGGYLGDRIGLTRVIRIASVIFVVGSLLALLFGENTSLAEIAAFQAIRGIGVSMSMGCTITWMLSDLPRRIVNDGSSSSVLVRQASASFGTAVMVFIAVVLGAGTMTGIRESLAFSAVLAVILVVVTFAFARDRRR